MPHFNKGKVRTEAFKENVRAYQKTHDNSGRFRKGLVPWDKGLHVRTNTGRTHIKKGQHIGVATQFKKGNIPPYKGKPFLAVRGEKNNMWKGGITKLGMAIRTCMKYRIWHSDCMTRDDFTCQICGLRGVELHVDHIKSFAQILRENNIKSLEQAMTCEELWNLNNGRVLCVPCHKKTESYLNKYYGK